MNIRGFTLVELIVVIALIGLLSALGSFGFSQYIKKSQIASQTRLLYGDLMEYRLKALYEKKNWTFKISATGYGIYSSALTTVAPVKTVSLKYNIENNNATDIVYDSQGMANVSGKSVCVTSANDAVVDSVVISQTRVQIGKRQAGANCDAGNIDAK
jgi:type IV pilus assembly protein PilA